MDSCFRGNDVKTKSCRQLAALPEKLPSETAEYGYDSEAVPDETTESRMKKLSLQFD